MNYSSPLMDFERNLAFFLGMFNHNMYVGLPQNADERSCDWWTSSEFMKGGLSIITPPDPFDEEKGETGTTSRSMLGSMIHDHRQSGGVSTSGSDHHLTTTVQPTSAAAATQDIFSEGEKLTCKLAEGKTFQVGNECL